MLQILIILSKKEKKFNNIILFEIFLFNFIKKKYMVDKNT